ncbi:MAG: 50S ribosomal protein L24 [Nanoarchaeota archaeon]
MKNRFSTHWKSSRRPGKQRKYLANAPAHLRGRLMNANLSKELRKKYGKRSFSLRKGDTVLIMSGKFRKKTGKVSVVDAKKMKVEIEGMQIKKHDGSKVNVKFNPSFLQIKELNLDDKKRNEKLTRKNKTAEGENKNAP